MSPPPGVAGQPAAAPLRPDSTNSVRAQRVLWGASAVGGLALSLAGAAGALLARQVSGSDAAAGLPQALLVAGSAAAALWLSALASRWGRRVSLAAGAAVAVAGCVLVAVGAAISSLLLVLVGSLLLGAGNTAVMLARYAAADLAAEDSRAKAMASVLMATAIGAVAGPNLLAPASSLGPRFDLPALGGPYVLAGAAFAVAAVALIAGLPAHTEPVRGPAAVAAPAAPVPLRAGRDGMVVLAVANLVMVAVMTMAPVQLHHLGHGLVAVGVVISAHIAAMFGPSPLSGWISDRLGPRTAATAATALLVMACALAAIGAGSLPVLGTAMVLLGLAWNLALISGSLLLTGGLSAAERPRREAWGEVSMGLAAAGGGVIAGPLVAGSGYPALALTGAVTAALLLLTPLARLPHQTASRTASR